MVVWGGKHAVPLLLELLEDRRHRGVRPELLHALGELRDERAAAPVARLLDSFDHERAEACLVRLGPLAEPAVLDSAARTTDDAAALKTIRVLKDFGSEKSLPMLRSALRHRNTKIRAEAKAAIQAVAQRTRPGTEGAAEQEKAAE